MAVPAVYQQPDGARVLRLTDFSPTSNGPAVHVLLINGSSTDRAKDFSLAVVQNVDLGDLKGNQGDQGLSLAQGGQSQPDEYEVSIYCRTLSRKLWHGPPGGSF